MPSLHELTDLFEVLPELPPPLPRQRRQLSVPESSTSITPVTPPTPESSVFRRLFSWAFPRQAMLHPTPVRRPNPFMALKAGKKIAVIAVVDAGSISFFRFGQGAFTEWPMV